MVLKTKGQEPGWYIRLLSSLYLATFLIRLSYGIITITFPDYTGVEENISFGFLWAAGPLAELFTVLFVGNLIDKYGRRWALLIGLIAGALSNYLIATSTNFTVLYAVTALHGAASGTILVTSLALLADYVPIKRRGREIGMFDGINLAGWGAGFFVGGVLKDFLGHENLIWAFVISGFLALIGCIYAYYNLKEPKKQDHTVKVLRAGHIIKVLKQRSILLLVLPWFVIYMLIADVFVFFPKASGQEFGVEGWVIGAVLAGACIAIVLFQRGYGALSDKIGRIKVMAIGIVGILVLMMMVGVVVMSIPGLSEESRSKEITFDSPEDFLDPRFTLGNGTIVDGSITSTAAQTLFQFGPYDYGEYDIDRLKLEFDCDGCVLSYYKPMENTEFPLEPGRSQEFDKGLDNVTFLVRFNRMDGRISNITLTIGNGPPPVDILGELMDRPAYLAIMALSGLMAGAFAPAALASLADEAHKRSRGVTMAIYIVMISLAQVIGPITTGYLLDNYGSMGFIAFLAGCGIFLAVVMIARWLDKRSKEKKGLSLDLDISKVIFDDDEE